MKAIERALQKSRREEGDGADVSSTADDARATKPERPAKRRVSPQLVELDEEVAEAAKEFDDRIVAVDYDNPNADVFRVLRTQILKALKRSSLRSVGVTSARPGEGKTFTSVNLASSLALSRDHSVLLIDLDLRRPRTHTYFGAHLKPGLTDCLGGSASLADCYRSTPLDNLKLIVAGTPVRNSSEVVGSSDMSETIDRALQTDPDSLVIFDLPPILASDDALTFSSKLDATLLVVEEGRTTVGEIHKALDLLASTTVLGTVLNKSRSQKNPYPYWYDYA